MTQALHVVFGAGQVGAPLAERLLAQGHRVRVAKRSPGGVPLVREMNEMLYQWEEPFVVADRRFRERFGAAPADPAEAARATLAWARAAYGPR